jgi:hypothetical protein
MAVYKKHVKSHGIGNWNFKKKDAPGDGVKDRTVGA